MSTNAAPEDVAQDEEWDGASKPQSRWFFLPLVAFCLCFYTSTMAQYSLIPQYIFKRLLQEHGLPASYSNASVCEINRSDPEYQQRKEIQSQSSMVLAKAMIIEGVPSILMVLIYGAYSDEMGRKLTILVPYFGSLIYTISVCLTVTLDLPFYVYFIGSFFYGLSGSYGTLLSGVFAYLADTTSSAQRSLGMGVMEACLGISVVISNFSVGYWLKAAGADPPMYAIISLLCVSPIFLFCVKESVVTTRHSLYRDDVALPIRIIESVKRQLSKIQAVFVSDRQRGRIMCLCIAAFSLHILCYVGSSGVITLYVLNKPFCWTSEWIGIFSGSKSAFWQLGMVVTLLLLRRRVSDWFLVYMGFISYIIYNTLLAVASLFDSPLDNILLVAAAGSGVFSTLCGAMIRTICSKFVVQEEQGVVFAAIAGSETIAVVIGFSSLNPIFAVTLWFYAGFVFAFMAGLMLIAIAIIAIAHRIALRRSQTSFAALQESPSISY